MGATHPVLGILGADSSQFAEEASSGVGAVVIAATWSNAEPAEGSFSSGYAAGLSAEIHQAEAAGLGVVLDVGLQYAPSWVFSLPGGTYFTDQYGDRFSGSQWSGNMVANGVTDPAVRSAEGAYLSWLGAQLGGTPLLAVRVGGGPFGELRYPSGYVNGHSHAFWAFDPSSQASDPVPGWRPGTGTPTQASQFLDWYNGNLDNYGIWLSAQSAAAFPGVTQLMMLPGWGERPFERSGEVNSLLSNGWDEYSEGLDWSYLLSHLPDPSLTVAYSTYLDAPSSTAVNPDPMDFLASIAPPGVRLGGENTGNGSTATLQAVVDKALALHLVIVDWMDQGQVHTSQSGGDPGGPNWSAVATAARQLGG